jgi:hypothetical protein
MQASLSFLSSFSSLATLGLLLLTRWVDHRFGKDTHYSEAEKPEPRGAVDGLWFTRGLEFEEFSKDPDNSPVSGDWPVQTTKEQVCHGPSRSHALCKLDNYTKNINIPT